MKHVLLFTPPSSAIRDVIQMASTWPRIGIAYIAGYLREKGIPVTVLDGKSLGLSPDEIVQEIVRQKPDIVAAGPFTEEIMRTYDVLRRTKEYDPEIVTVLGGPHATAIPERTLLESRDIDIIVCGEGEETMGELASTEGKDSYGKISGIAYRHEGKIRKTASRPLIADIDSLPYPAWDLFPLDVYRGRVTSASQEKSRNPYLELPLLSARGCPYQCNFCFKTFGNTLRNRDPLRVVDELEHNHNTYGITHTCFVEGTFAADPSIAHIICDEIIRRGLHRKITWLCETRIDRVDEELLRKVKSAGCEEVDFGVESGDEDILRHSKKGISIPEVKNTVRLAKKVGLKVACYFIIGHPFETRESIRRTYRLARELDPDIISVGIMIPYPGTAIMKMAEQGEGNYRLITTDWNEYTKQRGGPLETRDIGIQELRRIHSREYLKYYLRPSKLPVMWKTLPLRKIGRIVKQLISDAMTRTRE